MPHLRTLLVFGLLAGCGDTTTAGSDTDADPGTSDRPDAASDGATQPSDADTRPNPDANPTVDTSGLPDANDVAGADTTGATDGSSAVDEGFCGDIDILFVIDSSGSMGDNQRSLIASFPGFVEGMRTQLLDAPSFRVGVTMSDDPFSNAAPCTGIGSLITQTAGPESSGRSCGPFETGAAWLDHLEPDLEDKFACIAQVGVGGSDDERMMRAALNAFSPAFTAPGACNAGFGRPDALWILVLITDEDDVPDQCDGAGNCEDQASGGSPAEWVEELAAHRGGTTDDIVVLSLVGRRADNPCGAVVNSRILGFTRRFGDSGYVGDVCAESYDGFFADALPVIAQACAKR